MLGHELQNHNNMNNNHNISPPQIMSPRISFSNDFVDSQHVMKQAEQRREQAQVSTDFEFSVSNYSMMSGADELFFKGRILPFKDRLQRTIRDELLVGDDDFSLKPPKSGAPASSSSSSRWKGFLGLKRSHIGSKKVVKTTNSDVGNGNSVETSSRRSGGSKEHLSEGSSSCTEVEIGI